MTMTPYAVICRKHGQQFLSKHDYMEEMHSPSSIWSCPVCGRPSDWDDAHYDKLMYEQDED